MQKLSQGIFLTALGYLQVSEKFLAVLYFKAFLKYELILAEQALSDVQYLADVNRTPVSSSSQCCSFGQA